MKKNCSSNMVARRSTPVARAFTLIELLVVISIIGLLAGFLLSVAGATNKNKFLGVAKGEMAAIQAALERYKSVYGFYPPSNPNINNGSKVNPLYFELQGTINTNNTYVTLDGLNSVAIANLNNSLGVSGFINVTKGNGDDLVLAKNFLPDLKPTQIYSYTNGTPGPNNPPVPLLVSAAGGPDASYQPLGVPNANPWRYNSQNPTNNPGIYDLYLQLKIGGKTYLVCNWTKQTPVNNPLP